jgi:OmpA-OmpF porin, OOP family
VLAGLAALAEVDHGEVRIEAARLSVEGVSGNADARAEIARLLTDKLGEGSDLALSVRYDERLDPLADIPTPEACLRRVELILDGRKITFAPGSTEIEGESAQIMDEIAEVFRDCRKAEMDVEIAGHTDSQGREEMNLDLSEARAQSVLKALADRRVAVSRIRAKGYGESRPIADNDTEEGREANRRIEFRLAQPEPPEVAQVEGTAEAEADAQASDDATGDDATGAAEAAAGEETGE